MTNQTNRMIRTRHLLIVVALSLLWNSSFAQFVVQNNGALVTVNAGCLTTIKTGDLVNGSGTINNAGRITVEGDLVNNDLITGAGVSSGLFTVLNNWENNQTFISDQSRVILNGGAQSITGTSISSFYDLTLPGSGIKTMTLNAEISNVLELNGLELATQNNVLHVQNTSPSAIVANGGFVSSLGSGRLSWDMNSTSTYVFPLGSSTGTFRVRPLAIAPNTNAAHTFAARLANVNATSEGYDISANASDVCQVNGQFFHLIERVVGNGAADISQYYVAGQDGSWSNAGHWQNLPQWESAGASALATVAPYSTVTTTGWSDFSTSAFALINMAPQVAFNATALASCIEGSAIGLVGSPSGGVFAGQGVQGAQFVPSVAGVGSHEVTYSYSIANGCVGTVAQTIEVYAQPQVIISASQAAPYQLCQGQTVTFSATPGFADYDWSNSAQDASIEVGSSGTYSVIATDANGCEASSSSVNVVVNPVPTPVITANGPLEFCQGGTVQLSTSTGFGSYNWSNGGTSLSTTATSSGSYTVTVTNQFLCSGTSAPINVSVTAPTVSYIEHVGDSMYIVPSNGSSYQWFYNGSPIPGAIGTHYIATQSGNYSAQFVGDNGCESNTSVLELTYSGGNVGVDEQEIFTLLGVFPNPGKGDFIVKGILPNMEDVLIVVTDMLGKRLIPDIALNDTDQFNQVVDISDFANGVYFVRIQVRSGSPTVRYVKS